MVNVRKSKWRLLRMGKVEFERRQHIQLSELMQSLGNATNKVHEEVAILNSSSDRLEKLTKTLKNLTWALIVLTIAALIVPIGVEVWKANRHEVQDVRIVEPPPPTAPQTPTRPVR
jgi:hypothetical protein